MNQEINPYLQPQPDPFEDFNRRKKKREEHEIEFQRLCFEIFVQSDNGKALGDRLMKEIIIPSHYDPAIANAQTLSIWWDGYKAAMRKLIESGLIHQHRINQGSKNERQ